MINAGHTRCRCGFRLDLNGEDWTTGYTGATQCPRCGQWFDPIGRRLVDPENWDDPNEPEWVED